VEVEATYEIRLSGKPDPRLTNQFQRLESIDDPPETVLVGPLRDQSELHAVLALVDQLGLELVGVRRLPGSSVTSPVPRP
jgi:hypothetical protein